MRKENTFTVLLLLFVVKINLLETLKGITSRLNFSLLRSRTQPDVSHRPIQISTVKYAVLALLLLIGITANAQSKDSILNRFPLSFSSIVTGGQASQLSQGKPGTIYTYQSDLDIKGQFYGLPFSLNVSYLKLGSVYDYQRNPTPLNYQFSFLPLNNSVEKRKEQLKGELQDLKQQKEDILGQLQQSYKSLDSLKYTVSKRPEIKLRDSLTSDTNYTSYDSLYQESLAKMAEVKAKADTQEKQLAALSEKINTINDQIQKVKAPSCSLQSFSVGKFTLDEYDYQALPLILTGGGFTLNAGKNVLGLSAGRSRIGNITNDLLNLKLSRKLERFVLNTGSTVVRSDSAPMTWIGMVGTAYTYKKLVTEIKYFGKYDTTWHNAVQLSARYQFNESITLGMEMGVADKNYSQIRVQENQQFNSNSFRQKLFAEIKRKKYKIHLSTEKTLRQNRYVNVDTRKTKATVSYKPTAKSNITVNYIQIGLNYTYPVATALGELSNIYRNASLVYTQKIGKKISASANYSHFIAAVNGHTTQTSNSQVLLNYIIKPSFSVFGSVGLFRYETGLYEKRCDLTASYTLKNNQLNAGFSYVGPNRIGNLDYRYNAKKYAFGFTLQRNTQVQSVNSAAYNESETSPVIQNPEMNITINFNYKIL